MQNRRGARWRSLRHQAAPASPWPRAGCRPFPMGFRRCAVGMVPGFVLWNRILERRSLTRRASRLGWRSVLWMVKRRMAGRRCLVGKEDRARRRWTIFGARSVFRRRHQDFGRDHVGQLQVRCLLFAGRSRPSMRRRSAGRRRVRLRRVRLAEGRAHRQVCV
jgi:hypothetical protein